MNVNTYITVRYLRSCFAENIDLICFKIVHNSDELDWQINEGDFQTMVS